MNFDLGNIVKIDKDPLFRESDRGCVLICASDVENLLTRILENWARAAGSLSNSDWKKLSDYTGPLGTFSSKVEMARAIGLLDAPLYADINALRIIRNRAAHGNSDFSLSAPENATTIASMNCNHGKKSTITRYSLKRSTRSKSMPEEEETTIESIAKGYGLVRYAKSNFVLTVLDMKLALTRLLYLADAIGRMIPSIKREALHAMSKGVAAEDAKV